jgi:putative two-component system response regulator
VLPLIRHHHERWDGTGYPDGLRGEQIPLLARVLQTVDIYDALTNPRPYKPAFSPNKALRVMQEETDRGWRDPEIVKLFFTLHDSVIAKAGEFTAGNDRHLEAMRNTLARLR